MATIACSSAAPQGTAISPPAPEETTRPLTATTEPQLRPTPTTEPTALPTSTPDFVREEAPFDLVACTMTRAAQLPIEFEYFGTIPTGFDGINQANCTFTKEVASVMVTLSGPVSHGETFKLEPPTTEVSFPLPEGTLSISTLEIVPPGEYQREMTVVSVTGESLIISHQEGVLQNVTILEPVEFSVGRCTMTLAAQLPIEFEYFGTIPTGFDGINQANCTFTKEVASVMVTLSGPVSHGETFKLEPPTTEVSFPLPEGTLSFSTIELVPPGEYQREMTVVSVTGETLIISHQEGVLKTITILEPVEFSVGPCAMTRAAQLPIEFEYFSYILTGFDGINQANCTFSKEVEFVIVSLSGPATQSTKSHTFILGTPTAEVSFPLPEGTLRAGTADILPPGEYQREIVVVSVTGGTQVISDQPGVLKTITILEPVEFSVGPCTMTLAAPLPIELEYFKYHGGTAPTGFDGINQATCTFTKEVESVSVLLTGPETQGALYPLAEPSSEVTFPVPEGIGAISNGLIMPPGEYQRKISVVAVTGETLIISDQPGVLQTVTILEPPN